MTCPSASRSRKSAAAIPAALLSLLLLAACGKRREVVLQAERKAQIGGEFLRLYDDGSAEYGYGVVSEKLKAEGTYRYTGDTLWLDGGEFRRHFPAGFLVIKEGVVIMESGFHFLVTQDRKAP